MRWLGALAVVLVGAGIYLYWTLSEGSAKPPRSATSSTAAATASEAEAAPSANPSPPSQPESPTKPSTSTPRRDADKAPALAPSPAAIVPAGDSPKTGPATFDPDVAWTEAERQQWLWTAGGRFAKGNFPGALEASLEIARRNPGSAWEQDAWSIAIKSYCGMSEPEKASALFAKMTDQTGIDEALKGCAEWNVKLAKSP